MTAAIPAINKWLLTKQAGVAPSGPSRSGGSQSGRRAGGRGAGRRSFGVEAIPPPPPSESRGGEGEVSGWAGAGAVGGGTWRGEVRATVWSELSAVGQLSAPLSSPRLCQIQSTWLSNRSSRPAALARPSSTLVGPNCPPPHIHHPSGDCTDALSSDSSAGALHSARPLEGGEGAQKDTKDKTSTISSTAQLLHTHIKRSCGIPVF